MPKPQRIEQKCFLRRRWF